MRKGNGNRTEPEKAFVYIRDISIDRDVFLVRRRHHSAGDDDVDEGLGDGRFDGGIFRGERLHRARGGFVVVGVYDKPIREEEVVDIFSVFQGDFDDDFDFLPELRRQHRRAGAVGHEPGVLHVVFPGVGRPVRRDRDEVAVGDAGAGREPAGNHFGIWVEHVVERFWVRV